MRLHNAVHVVLEVKGNPQADNDAKHQGAKRWISAVNHWGKLGEWDFLVCRDPQRLDEELGKLAAQRNRTDWPKFRGKL